MNSVLDHFHDEILEMNKQYLSYDKIANVISEKYKFYISTNAIKNYFIRNGIKKIKASKAHTCKNMWG